MRIKKVFYFINFFILLQSVIISNVCGNPIFPYYFNPTTIVILTPIMYFLSSTIEYGIILQFIKKFVINRKKFALLIFKINLITFPSAQVVMYIISFITLTLINYYVIIIEIIVPIVEFLLLKRGIYKLTLSHYVNESIQSEKLLRIFFSVFIANIYTFLLGILILFPLYLYDIRLTS